MPTLEVGALTVISVTPKDVGQVTLGSVVEPVEGTEPAPVMKVSGKKEKNGRGEGGGGGGRDRSGAGVGERDGDGVSAETAAGDKYVSILGPRTAKKALDTGLVDEVLVHIAPVLLGDGLRLFDQPGGTNVKLEVVGGPQVTNLWARVKKS